MGNPVPELCLVDRNTGEVVEDYVLFIGKNPRYLDRGYIKVFTAFLSDVVESSEIAGKSIRLLFYMLQHLDYDSLEFVIIPQEAQQSLKISEKTFYNWVNDLIRFGLIEKVNRYRYRLKPYVAVKGSHEKANQLSLREGSKE